MACDETIKVNDQTVTCKLELGPGHNPRHDFYHHGELRLGASSGITVEWMAWREVRPPRV